MDAELRGRPGPPRGPKRRGASAWIQAIDRTGATESILAETGHGRATIAVTDRAIWVAYEWGRSLAKLDRETLAVTGALNLETPAVGLAEVGDSIWVLGKNGWLWKVEQEEMTTEGVARLGSGARAMSSAETALWVLRRGGELTRVDPASGEATITTGVGHSGRHLAASPDSVWADAHRGRALIRVDPQSGAITAKVRPPGRLIDLAFGGPCLWIITRRMRVSHGGNLVALDARTGELFQEHQLHTQPSALAAEPHTVSVAVAKRLLSDQSRILALDPSSGLFEAIYDPRWWVTTLAPDGDRLLAASYSDVVGRG